MTTNRSKAAKLLPLAGVAAALAIGLSAPASAIPQGCTNLSGGSGTPNNGSQPGGTGTGAGANNTTGGISGGGARSSTPCTGGGSSDEVHTPDNHSGNVGGGAGGGGVPLDQH